MSASFDAEFGAVKGMLLLYRVFDITTQNELFQTLVETFFTVFVSYLRLPTGLVFFVMKTGKDALICNLQNRGSGAVIDGGGCICWFAIVISGAGAGN